MEALNPFFEYLKNPDTAFGVFDLVYGLLLIYGFIRGLFRGLPEELSQLLGTLLVFFGSMKFYTPISSTIMEHTRLEDPTASLVLSYLLIFLVLMITWKLITLLIRKALDWSCPKQLKRLGGALIGTAKSAVLIVVVLTAVLISDHKVLRRSMIEESGFGRQVSKLLPDNIVLKEPAAPVEAETEENGSGDT
ncbi:CvpA family protein [Kiritimatiellaeota bacterium B1221]|nr:CvpA family protein [Kiritimatiellaeota bacterium B1221]